MGPLLTVLVVLAASAPAPDCKRLEQDDWRVTGPVLIYVRPLCDLHAMSRERFDAAVACEDANRALHLQRRRLSSALSRRGVTVLECTAVALRVQTKQPDGAVQKIELGGWGSAGTVLVAPSKAPLPITGVSVDADLLKRLDEYVAR
jgi:hypothetical protein